MENETVQQKKRQADKAREAEGAEALAKQGKKRDVNGKIINSPQHYIETAAREAGPTFKPVAMTAGDNGAYVKGSTSIGTYYNRKTLENGTEKVRTKSYRGGKTTKEETFKLEKAEDGKESYRRTGKKEIKGNSTREVSYAEDGSKIVTKTNSRGTSTRKIDEDGKSETLHRKVGKFYERRYEIKDGEKELVAKRNGLSSQYTQTGEDGSKLTKTKELGGLYSKTVKINKDGEELLVAKRSGTYRLNTYDNDDGTKNTIERRKGWMKKTTEQNYIAGEKDGDGKIRETVTIKRLGGLFKSTTTNTRALNDDEQKHFAAKKLPLLREEATKATRAMGEGLTAHQNKLDDKAAQETLMKLVAATVQSSAKYLSAQEIAGPKLPLDAAIRELGKQDRNAEILKSTTEEKATEALKSSAKASVESEAALADAKAKLDAITLREGKVGMGRALWGPSEDYSQAKKAADAQTVTHKEEAEKFDKSARSYVEYMNAKNPNNKPLDINEVKKGSLEKQRAPAEQEIEKAKSLQSSEPSAAVKADEKKLLAFAAGINGSKPDIEAFAAELASSPFLLEHAARSRGLGERPRDASRGL